MAPFDSSGAGRPLITAVSTVAIALALRAFLDPLLGNALPYGVVYVAVAAATWIGGHRAGIAAAILGGVTATFFFVEPRYSFLLLNGRDVLGLGLYLSAASMFIAFGWVATRAARAESRGPGSDSVSTVRLPAKAADRPRLPVDASAPPAGVAPRVLIVDDNVDGATTLAALLGLAGFDTDVAHDGWTALTRIERDQPDAVVLDLSMPGLDGYQVCQRVTARGGRRPLLVALTGWTQAADALRTREAGFDAHLSKPVDCAALQSLLATARPLARRSTTSPDVVNTLV